MGGHTRSPIWTFLTSKPHAHILCTFGGLAVGNPSRIEVHRQPLHAAIHGSAIGGLGFGASLASATHRGHGRELASGNGAQNDIAVEGWLVHAFRACQI